MIPGTKQGDCIGKVPPLHWPGLSTVYSCLPCQCNLLNNPAATKAGTKAGTIHQLPESMPILDAFLICNKTIEAVKIQDTANETECFLCALSSFAKPNAHSFSIVIDCRHLRNLVVLFFQIILVDIG